MFNTNFDITGIHANYLKDLCELRGNDIVNIGLHFILKNVRPYAAPCSEA